MTSNLSAEAASWRQELDAFLAERRAGVLPRHADLSPIQDAQRRVSGGLLKHFFEFLERKDPATQFPILYLHPLEERVFVFVTDEAGATAARDLMDLESPLAVCLLKEEWRTFLEDPSTDDDDEFTRHYQFWSVWHQNLPTTWEIPQDADGEYWVHEEGYALAERVGRGAQHLWRWDGEELTLVREGITSWVS